jgi:hypothetical protein
MDYLLTGSRQMAGVRVFAFDGVASDRTRTSFTVSIDTALIRKYAITLQELPLLCRQLLEKRGIDCGTPAMTFTETEMAELAAARAEVLREAQLRKFNRKLPTPNPSVNRGFTTGMRYPS